MVLNRYFIWNAYTHNVPVYMLCKLVIINQAKEMLHCLFNECASNFSPQKSPARVSVKPRIWCYLPWPTPHMWKAQQTHFSRPSGRAPSLCLFSFPMLLVFLLSLYLLYSLSLYDHVSSPVAEHCEIGVSDYGAVLAGKNLAIFQASSYPGCPTFI